MSGYKINAGFEGDIDWCKCRWIVVWKELENSIAGLIGGLCGGGAWSDHLDPARQGVVASKPDLFWLRGGIGRVVDPRK